MSFEDQRGLLLDRWSDQDKIVVNKFDKMKLIEWV